MRKPGSGVLPPGPPLPGWAQAALLLIFAPRFVAVCRRRYGSVFTLRIPSMGTLVYLADPDDIKAVFAGNPSIFHAGEANSMLSGLVGENSVLVLDEDVHRDRRRLLMAPFHRDAVARQAAMIAEIAAANIAEWPVDTEFAVAPKMSQITLDVILQTMIGASDPARLAALRKLLPRLLKLGPWASLAVAKPSLQRHRPWRGLARRLQQADRLLYAEIAEHRADPGLAERNDLLAMLITATDGQGRTMTDGELRDQLMTLLVAGHDTTATSLSWALERLTRHPAVLATAVRAAEASAAGDRAGDDYLDAVAKETLRVRPVVFDVGRVLTQTVELAGYQLPAGVVVVPGITLVHTSAEHYPRPERFDPDRMLGAALSPTTWLPFGGGNRRCLGATFAMVEMRVVLREVLLKVELSTTTAADERQKLKHVTLVPHRGARIRARSWCPTPAAGDRGATTPGAPQMRSRQKSIDSYRPTTSEPRTLPSA